MSIQVGEYALGISQLCCIALNSELMSSVLQIWMDNFNARNFASKAESPF